MYGGQIGIDHALSQMASLSSFDSSSMSEFRRKCKLARLSLFSRVNKSMWIKSADAQKTIDADAWDKDVSNI